MPSSVNGLCRISWASSNTVQCHRMSEYTDQKVTADGCLCSFPPHFDCNNFPLTQFLHSMHYGMLKLFTPQLNHTGILHIPHVHVRKYYTT